MVEEIKRTGREFHLVGCETEPFLQTVLTLLGSGVELYMLNNGGKSNSLPYCIDYILELEGHFAGKDIYIEESCSVVRHILQGNTLGDKQCEVIRVFKAAMNEADRVFLMDTEQNNRLNFFHSLCPEKELIVIDHPVARTGPSGSVWHGAEVC